MDKSVGNVQEYAGTGLPVGYARIDGLGFLGGPPLLPSPALLDAQSRSGPVSYQGGKRSPERCGFQKQHGGSKQV